MNFFNIGPFELIMILVIVVIVFGPSKIPEIGASIGSSLRKFRDASREITNDLSLEDLNPSTLVDALAARAEAAEKAEASSSTAPAAEGTAGVGSPAPEATPAAEPPAAEAVATPAVEEPAIPATPQRRRFLVAAPRPATGAPDSAPVSVEAPVASVQAAPVDMTDSGEPAVSAAVADPAPASAEAPVAPVETTPVDATDGGEPAPTAAVADPIPASTPQEDATHVERA